MTAEGLKKLREELENLKNSERPSVIKAIADAREHGDLSENAEYHAARERQSFIEGRIVELENKIVGGSIPKEFIKPTFDGIKEAALGGVVAGYPVIDFKVTSVPRAFSNALSFILV